MRRRRLLATAGALSATAFAVTVAIGANFGLVGEAQPRSPVGRLTDRRHAADATTSMPPPAVAVTTPALGPNADD